MLHTRFYDDQTVVGPGRVAAYDSGAHHSFPVDWSTTREIVGGGGLIMSAVHDLLLWDRNFHRNRLGKGTLIRELQTPGVLNNGNKISYAMGMLAIRLAVSSDAQPLTNSLQRHDISNDCVWLTVLI
jgi:hypothetical protein